MKPFHIIAVAASALAVPADGLAQACVGNATPDGGWGIEAIGGVARYDLPEEVTAFDLGVEGTANLSGPLDASAAYIMRIPESGDLQVQIGEGILRLGVPRELMPRAVPLAICAFGGAAFSATTQESSESDFTSTTYPVGIGVGFPLAISPQLTLFPSVSPQYLFANVEGEVIGFPIEESDDGFAIEFGSGFRYGSIIGSANIFMSTLSSALGATPYPAQGFTLKLGVGF